MTLTFLHDYRRVGSHEVDNLEGIRTLFSNILAYNLKYVEMY